MPNVFRNSAVDSLTQSVNSLRGRQMQAEESQMRMMSLNSELATQEAERKLLPQKLKLEEDRLGYEMDMRKKGMDIEVAKTAEGILTSRLNRAVTMNQESREAAMAPFDMKLKEYQTLAMAQKLAYLPAQLSLEIFSGMQQNTVRGLQGLTMAMPMIADTLKRLQEVKITSGTVMGEALTEFNSRFYQYGDKKNPAKITGIGHKGMKQMYEIAKDDGLVTSVNGFAGQTLNQVMGKAETLGGFFKDGVWQEPSDGQITASLVQATSDVYKPKLMSWVRKKDHKKFASQFAIIDRVNAIREAGGEPDVKELGLEKDAKDYIMGHISISDNGEFKIEDDPTGGDISMTIWDNFYGGTNATKSARDYMIGANEIDTAEAAAAGSLDIMNKTAALGTNIIGGEQNEHAKKMVDDAQAAFYIDKEKLMKQLDAMYDGQSENDLAIDMFTSPAEWGIIGIDANEAWGRHFFETDIPLSQQDQK